MTLRCGSVNRRAWRCREFSNHVRQASPGEGKGSGGLPTRGVHEAWRCRSRGMALLPDGRPGQGSARGGRHGRSDSRARSSSARSPGAGDRPQDAFRADPAVLGPVRRLPARVPPLAGTRQGPARRPPGGPPPGRPRPVRRSRPAPGQPGGRPAPRGRARPAARPGAAPARPGTAQRGVRHQHTAAPDTQRARLRGEFVLPCRIVHGDTVLFSHGNPPTATTCGPPTPHPSPSVPTRAAG